MAGFYPFDHQHDVDGDELRALVGGKGAGLAEMTRLGIPVPPGFTIPTTTCLAYLDGGWSEEMAAATRAGVESIQSAVGRSLGDPSAPLLVSVRSGAAVSMPGMMDTVLNAGMTEDVARGLASLTGDASYAWDTHRRAVVSFAQVVLGAEADQLAVLADATAGNSDEESAMAFARAVSEAGYVIPADPLDQIYAAVEAVFRSWHSDRAVTYRNVERIDHGLGTAATIQTMVFGNMGERSGTGVAFSRNPSTGEAVLTGDFLTGAQGEDVVAGTHQTVPLDELASTWPEVWDKLIQVSSTLEHHTADMVDLEFTVEDGKLWLLQTRRAKRSPAAVFRSAVEMANDPEFPVDRAEAVRRCQDHMDDPPCLPGGHNQPDDAGDNLDGAVLATGLAASPGRSIGVVSLDPDDAVEREQRGERVILIREETSPADIHGMAASVGLVTTLGGMVSHAAVVARSWGLAAVVGCQGIKLESDALVAAGQRVAAGTTVTVCGDTGQLLLGEHPAGTQPLPEVETIRGWARQGHDQADPASDTAAANVDTPTEEVGADDCLRLVVLKGMAKADGLVEPLGGSEDAISGRLSELEQQGFLMAMKGERYMPTPDGTARVAELYATESAAGEACATVLEGDFHPPNMLLKEVVTAWQIRTVDGQEVPNDHSDADYDATVIERLRSEVHPAVQPIIADLATHLPRLARYEARLQASLERLAGGDARYMANPMLDSYHTVWFELHEELIKLAGRDRKSETEAGRA